MNIFVRELVREQIDRQPALSSDKFSVEDNVGESIHVHYRNLRIELSVDDFRLFADEVTRAAEELDDGHR